jgi:hypothetical protein
VNGSVRRIQVNLITSRWLNSAWTGRAVLFVMGLGLVLAGIRLLSVGPMSDGDKWRGFLFAPLAVVLGLVFLIVLIATWRRDRDPRSMPKGSADRRLRKGRSG